MKRLFWLLIISVTFSGCIKLSLTNRPIEVDKIFGTYINKDVDEVGYREIGTKRKLVLSKDYTFQYQKIKDGVEVFNEKGCWRYWRPGKYNQLDLFVGADTLPTPSQHHLYKHYVFFACSFWTWRQIRIGKFTAGDPDGLPAIPWLQKVTSKHI